MKNAHGCISIISLLRWVYQCWVPCRIVDLGLVIGFSDLIRNHFSHKLLVAIMGSPPINCTCPRCNCRIDLTSIHGKATRTILWWTHANLTNTCKRCIAIALPQGISILNELFRSNATLNQSCESFVFACTIVGHV